MRTGAAVDATTARLEGRIVAVARSAVHGFSKDVVPEIRLLAGLGVEGDAHAGVTVQHRSRVAADPTQANLRQVHMIPVELLARLAARGFDIGWGALGENIATEGLELRALPVGTQLRVGDTVCLELTGLRNPCGQIDAFRPGLLKEVVGRDEAGRLVRKAGVMAIVLAGGLVRAGDAVAVELPGEPHRPLDRV